MSKGEPPPPTDPFRTAAAQTGTNVSTAVANSFLNNINQNTADGSLRYDVTGNYQWTDPADGRTYNIPIRTATQSLSQQGNAIKGQTDAARMNLAGMANSQSQRLSSLLGHEMDLSGAPGGGDANAIGGVGQALTSYDSGGQIQRQLGDAGDITKSYGPADDFSSDRQRVEDALMGRMNTQLGRERGNIEQRLSDQGIRYGSQAYTSAMDDYNRQSNDARFAAIGQAGQEQQRMMDMAAQRAGFQNAAQQQQFDQLQGRGTFANLAQAQQNQQNAGAASFNNAGLAQQLAQQQSLFNARNSQRNQYLEEQYQQRNQPLKEIAAMMSGSQIQGPNWLNNQGSQIATTDIGGLINQNWQQQNQNYQSQNQNWQQMMGGILGLGAGALKFSDERLKKDIDPVGTVFAYNEDAERKGLPIYTYQYKDDPTSTRHVGPMAQDVEKIDPGAVRNIRGRKAIDTKRVMGNILRAA